MQTILRGEGKGQWKGEIGERIFPIVAGVLSALLVWKFVASRFSALAALCACGLVFGTIAAFISRELFISWVFLVIDTAVVLISATATTAIVTWRQWNSRGLH
jgi:uncharacterized membrane protein